MSTSEIPDIITDSNNNVKFVKDQYLGKGGYGRCYVLKCLNTGNVYAGKFLDKRELEKYNVTDRIVQEINVHKRLNHDNIVCFKSFIQDTNFIYIILELCTNRSMSELIKRRQYITNFEAKYYMRQVVSGISYLHEKNIIHRDLKLANLFISHNMVLKIGDFGLAVKVSNGKSTRRSLCGTPNYIAPEVLSRQGHSFAVDVWALGCILYTLLVGTPPFQTETIEETYKLIAKCQYTIPETLKSCTASHFISCTLQKDPTQRPTIFDLSNHDFLNIGFIPKKLPSTCIVMPPRTKTLIQYSNRRRKYPLRSPLSDINLNSINQSRIKLTDDQLTRMLEKLLNNIKAISTSNVKTINIEDTQNPSLRPFMWINSWLDYSHKYGFGYRLNNNTVGALFNDVTTLLILPSGKNAHYYQRDGNELYLSIEEANKTITKKFKIMKSFRNFMFDSLRNAYEDYDPEDEPLSSLPILKNWVNSDNIVGMFLSNGTLQLNFLVDHIKLILCPIMDAVTVIGYGDQFTTYQMDLLKIYGCDKLLLNKLQKAMKSIHRIWSERSELCNPQTEIDVKNKRVKTEEIKLELNSSS